MSRPSSDNAERSPLVLLVVLLGGLVFGVGLAVSEMAKPEVVLDFPQRTEVVALENLPGVGTQFELVLQVLFLGILLLLLGHSLPMCYHSTNISVLD